MPVGKVFLSYNSADRLAVEAIRRLIEAHGISTFFDREDLRVGLPWPHALEEALHAASAVAVFIGRELGGWQKREIGFALDLQIRHERQGNSFPVIPVLISGADLTPAFLFLNTWIDLRAGLNEPEGLEAINAFQRGLRSAEIAVGDGAFILPSLNRPASVCPYRGLQMFREEDAAFFFGQTAAVGRLLDLTLGTDFVGVVGPSGSGKSSVVHGGLVPLLRRRHPPERTWDVVSFTPGREPFHRLASVLVSLLDPDLTEVDRLKEAQKLGSALAIGEIKLESAINRAIERANGTDRILLIIDQFEELFRLTPEPNRQPFVTALLQTIDSAPLTVLLSVRADFYGHLIDLDRNLSDRLGHAQLNIGALTRDELRETIQAPARIAGLEFESGLVERILTDAGSEPGYLPLVQFALTELWQRRQGAVLTHDAYDRMEGVAGALAKRAEAEFAKSTEHERIAARRLFSRLVHVATVQEEAKTQGSVWS